MNGYFQIELTSDVVDTETFEEKDYYKGALIPDEGEEGIFIGWQDHSKEMEIFHFPKEKWGEAIKKFVESLSDSTNAGRLKGQLTVEKLVKTIWEYADKTRVGWHEGIIPEGDGVYVSASFWYVKHSTPHKLDCKIRVSYIHDYPTYYHQDLGDWLG